MPRRPVHTLLAEAAYAGRELEKKELAELQLSTADTAHVKRAAREAAFMYDGGERGKAREHARQRSQEIIASLPAEAQDPRYLHEPEQLDHLGPAELAPPEIARLLAAYRELAAEAPPGERYWYDAARRMTVLALSMGLRRGELLGLRWADVELLERRLHVARLGCAAR